MLEPVFASLEHALRDLLPASLVFIALAAVIKREQVLIGLKAARREMGTNLGLLLFNAAVLVPLVALPLGEFREAIPHPAAMAALWEEWPKVVVVIAAIVLIDLAAYWRHRWEHSSALWRIHATHHADEAMNWLTLHRKHPLGEALSMVCDLVIVLLLGLPVWAIVAAALLRSWWGYFIHADVPWTLGLFGKVLMSPAAHRLHHIRDEALMGSNYGNTITLWDRLFGTYIDPAPYIGCETGIAEGTRNVAGELLRPFEARYWRGSVGNAGGEAVIAPTQNIP
jgi:sterol desaturase/sphingolipid hydroxylase (fatty acid hydroxylase superfamily)